jgi:hypothetical protein
MFFVRRAARQLYGWLPLLRPAWTTRDTVPELGLLLAGNGIQDTRYGGWKYASERSEYSYGSLAGLIT